MSCTFGACGATFCTRRDKIGFDGRVKPPIAASGGIAFCESRGLVQLRWRSGSSSVQPASATRSRFCDGLAFWSGGHAARPGRFRRAHAASSRRSRGTLWRSNLDDLFGNRHCSKSIDPGDYIVEMDMEWQDGGYRSLVIESNEFTITPPAPAYHRSPAVPAPVLPVPVPALRRYRSHSARPKRFLIFCVASR